MNEAPEHIGTVRQWIEKAEHDLRNAEHTLMLGEGCPFDTICFHAQQCVEKYFKALLVLHSTDFPRTHDLRVIMQLVSSCVDLGLPISEIVALNRYAVETRYPGHWEPITRSEAEEAVAQARKVRSAVRVHLPPQAA